MHILHFIYDDIKNPWCGGGGAIRTFEIYKRLSKRNKIVVVCGMYQGAKRDEVIEGIRYIRIGNARNYLISILTYSLALLFFKTDENFNLVIKDFSPYTPMFTFRLKINKCIALFQNYIGIHIFKDQPILLGLLPYLFEKNSTKRFIYYLASSNSVYAELSKRTNGCSIISVIPYGVSDDLFGLKPTDGDYILFLGRFDIYQKGLDILLESFAKVNKDYPNITLLMAGGGKDEIKLKKMVMWKKLEGNVKFIGRVFGDKKRELLSNCLFACRPSRFESFGLGALEASACGKAVVCSRIDGNCEVIVEGETGIMVDSDNANQLANAIIELIKNTSKRKKLAENGAIHAKKFRWDKISQDQETFYEKILRNEHISFSS